MTAEAIKSSASSMAPGNPAGLTMDGAVAVITISKPPLNLFDGEMGTSILKALDEAEDAGARAIVVRATGPHFSGGADVRQFAGVSARKARAQFISFYPFIARLEEVMAPTICSVQGLCIAAGLELALSCDLIIAGHSAQFAQTEARIGTATLLGGVQRLAERAGSARAREIIYTADMYPAETFERWNIVNWVVPDTELEERTLAIARRLAKGPTKAYSAGKRLVRAFIDSGLTNSDRRLLDIAMSVFDSEDMKSGVETMMKHGVRKLEEMSKFTGN